MTIKKNNINFAPKQLVYKKIIVAVTILACCACGVIMGGLGFNTYKQYSEVADLEAQVVQMQQVVNSSNLPKLEALRVQYAELTQNAGDNGTFIPATKYTYTEMINLVNKHIPNDFHIYAVNGKLSIAGVYSYSITLYSEERRDIADFLEALQGEDLAYCTVNSITKAQVNVGTQEEAEYQPMWLYVLNIGVGGL